MPLNLIELIKASGSAGTSGQSFANNVTGAGSGVSMSSYKVTGQTWTGQPATPSVVNIYQADTLLNVTLSPTRGANAYRIQRLTSGAFTISMSAQAGWNLTGHSIALETFSQSNNGGTFNLGLRIAGALNYSHVPSSVEITTSYDNGQTTQPGGGVLWSGTHYAYISNVNLGYQDYTIFITYDIDSANFNDPATIVAMNGAATGWPIRVNNRMYALSELQFRWWDNSTDATNNNSSTTISTTSSVNWYSYSQNNQQYRNVWFRWRYGSDAWSGVSSISITDTRNDQ